MDSETTDIHYNGQKTPCVYECQHQSMKNTTIPWDVIFQSVVLCLIEDFKCMSMLDFGKTKKHPV